MGAESKLEADLISVELKAGTRIPLALENSVTLRDGMNYSISIIGTDFAGNISEELKVENITYDISPPELSISHPKTDSFVNYLDVVYSVNEPLLSGRMEWINDRKEKMIYDLRAEDILSGKHVLVNYDIKPEEEMPYWIMIEGMDLAGNEANSINIRNVMFDITPTNIILF